MYTLTSKSHTQQKTHPNKFALSFANALRTMIFFSSSYTLKSASHMDLVYIVKAQLHIPVLRSQTHTTILILSAKPRSTYFAQNVKKIYV